MEAVFDDLQAPLHPGVPVKIAAIVTDPDGVDDVVGGRLLGQGGAPEYGPFANLSGNSWEITLTWEDFSALGPVTNFGLGVRAEFDDSTGLSGFRTHWLETCDGEYYACPDTCTRLEWDQWNCGVCGHECGFYEICQMGRCVDYGGASASLPPATSIPTTDAELRLCHTRSAAPAEREAKSLP